ncbi:hypothetical protein [Tardiphaga sp.]|jgi:hypothetical protein|uniref:hypothetical protein n=1 Tax=Tardiphaga sp. TaxID=1926292 RepID=UPI0037D9FE75
MADNGRVQVDAAIEAFGKCEIGEDILINLVVGLRCIGQIADSDDVMRVTQGKAKELVESIVSASRKLAPNMVEAFPDDRFMLGMTGAFGLASLFGKSEAEVKSAITEPLLHDHFDHLLLLMCEVQKVCCMQRIEHRGHLLRDIMFDRSIVNISRH